MQEPVRTRIFVSVPEGDFVAYGILLEEGESVPETKVVIGFRQQTRAHEIRAKHHEEIRRRARALGFAGRRGLPRRGLAEQSTRKKQRKAGECR